MAMPSVEGFGQEPAQSGGGRDGPSSSLPSSLPSPWPALAERIPALVQDQFGAYRRLMALDAGEGEGPREVTAWENARKAALGHLQALIRLYDLVQAHLGRADGGGELDRMLADVLAGVRRELAADAAGDADGMDADGMDADGMDASRGEGAW